MLSYFKNKKIPKTNRREKHSLNVSGWFVSDDFFKKKKKKRK